MPDTSLDNVSGSLGYIVDEQLNVVGTGFQVAPGLVITALHVVGPLALQDADRGFRVVPLKGGQPQPAVIQAAAGDRDLVLLRCEEPIGRSIAEFFPSRAVDRGTRVAILAAAPVGRLTRVDARWHGTNLSGSGVRQGYLSTLDSPLLPGMSGSPVVDAHNRFVVGVLLGVAPDRTTGAGPTLRVAMAEDVAQFLDEVGREARSAPVDRPHLLYETGVVAGLTGDERAAGLLERAVESFQSAGDPSSAAIALRSLGQIALRDGDADAAERQYRRALALCQELRWTRALAACYEDLGRVNLLRNDFHATRRHARRALSILAEVGDIHGTAQVHALLGIASEGLGNVRDAETRYRSARNVYDELGDISGSANTCYQLALLAYRRSDHNHAIRYLHEAVAGFERADEPDRQAESHRLLGQVAEEDGLYDEARGHFERALDLYEQTGHTRGQTTSLQLLGSITFRQREFHYSSRYLQQALSLFESMGHREGVSATLGNLSIIAATEGRSDQALLYLIRAIALADTDHQHVAALRAQLSDIRNQVGTKQFDELLRSAISASEPAPEWLLRRLSAALTGSESGYDPAWIPGDTPKTPPGPPDDSPNVAGDDDEPQIINIWIGERENNPTVPLLARHRYTLVFRVGLPHPGNLAEGPREIARDAIPHEGLATTWVVSSTDVAISASLDDAVGTQIDIADSGGTAQWMASFELTVPARGDSEKLRLAIVPLCEGQARIEVAVSIEGDLYRWLQVNLTVSPPTAMPAVMPPAPSPTATSGSGQQHVISTTLMHGPPLRHVAPGPSADWQTPATRLNITLQPPQAHLYADRLNLENIVRWAPNCALIEGQIQRVRNALDQLRLEQQEYFDGIDPGELAARLATFQPTREWAQQTVPGDRWSRIATCPALRRLAQEGYVLYQSLFETESEMRKAVDDLQPGDMLSITWFPIAQYVAHVPWALMYREPPPPPGEPVDPENFLGIRLRLRYVSHQMPYLRSLGSQDSFTRAHLMYWGRGSDDPVAIEKERHLDELKQWNPYVLPTAVPGKPEIVQFLDNPAPNPVRVVYIYCRSIAADQDGPGFRFGNGPRKEDTVNLSEIGVAAIPDRPLVFANACGTSAGSPYVPNELEERFFLRGCSAFIGTECKVPITFAARFATTFFHFLYADNGKPTPAGEALAQARRFFWSEYGIIGGLFYSYVNDYDLYVASDTAVAALSRLRRES